MIKFFGNILGAIGAGTMWVIMLGALPGWVYWLWMASHLGSFWMFLLAFLGPFGMIASLLGLWSLLFGIPNWLL